jgi:DNA-directed RNA polymerase specialized sigma24 family protein
MDLDRFRDLLKRSSLGTPGAQANRASVPAGMIERILNRAEQLERSQAAEQDACMPIATVPAPPERTEERCRTALFCVFICWESELTPVINAYWEQAAREVATSEELERARDAIMRWSEAYRSAPSRRSRITRLRLRQFPASLVPPTGGSKSETGLHGLARWAVRLWDRELPPWDVQVVSEFGTGKSFTFSGFFQQTVPSVERAARLLTDDTREDECVNEAVAAALAEASNRWRWLAVHPAPMTWTVRTALEALDPTIALRRCSRTVEPISLGYELWQGVIQSLWNMPTHHREVIGLWATCGFESNQIAHVLDLPERQVRQVKDQALRQLQATDPCCQ